MLFEKFVLFKHTGEIDSIIIVGKIGPRKVACIESVKSAIMFRNFSRVQKGISKFNNFQV